MREDTGTEDPKTEPDDAAFANEYQEVLQLVADGKVSPEQAERLLRLMDRDQVRPDDALVGRPMADIARAVIRPTI